MELSDAAVGEVVESMMTYSMATAGSHISSPQGPVDFYEILKVPRTAADSTIIEAHVQQLVSIPYVAQYMERYVRADAAEWDALWDAFRDFRRDPVGDKTRYEALLHAHARVRSGHASDSSYDRGARRDAPYRSRRSRKNPESEAPLDPEVRPLD